MECIPWNFIKFLGKSYVDFIILFHNFFGLLERDLHFRHYASDSQRDGRLKAHIDHIGKFFQYLKAAATKDHNISVLSHCPQGPVEHIYHFIPALMLAWI